MQQRNFKKTGILSCLEIEFVSPWVALLFPQFELLHSLTCVLLWLMTIPGNCCSESSWCALAITVEAVHKEDMALSMLDDSMTVRSLYIIPSAEESHHISLSFFCPSVNKLFTALVYDSSSVHHISFTRFSLARAYTRGKRESRNSQDLC
jgi:hypothetical protein